MRKNRMYRVILLALLSSLLACETEIKSASETVQPTVEHTRDKKSIHPSIGKPGAAVSLRNSQPLQLPATGVQDVVVQLMSPVYQGVMHVSVSSNEDIAIVSAQKEFEFTLVEQGDYQLPLTLNIATAGRHYLHLQVVINTKEQTQARAIAVIVQVGEPVLKTQKTDFERAAEVGEQVISLPAQETISPR